MTDYLTSAQQLKIELLANGVIITPRAKKALTAQGGPISVFEYPTTGGVTLEFEKLLYINAPFHGPYKKTALAKLDIEEETGCFIVELKDTCFKVNPVPLPGYLNQKDSKGRLITEVVISHADRARISPIQGCSFKCRFCDLNQKEYRLYPVEQLKEALSIAIEDKILPVSHVLISGGTPYPEDRKALDQIYKEIITDCPLPVDVMFAPRSPEDKIVDRFYKWGVYGYSINIELFDRESLKKYAPQKQAIGLDLFSRHIERAVELTGGKGRVRSLLLLGLEPIEKTLEGVKWLAKRGCDPVLSPFRPPECNGLQNHRLPTREELTRVWVEANEIVEKYNVKIGPRCIPCQHNALAFPYDSRAYYFSKGQK